MGYKNINEESLKLKIKKDYFEGLFDCTDIIKRIDFMVKVPTDTASLFGDEYLLWAEAKKDPTDIYRILAQLLLTIYQDANTLNPPKFAGCIDNEKISFIEYHYVLPVFNENDFDWTQTPSAVNNKTVETVRNIIDHNQVFTFYFDHDQKELRNFIKQNFALTHTGNLLSTQINRNNYIFIYQKWRKMVLPYIEVNWGMIKKTHSIYERDFFLAELNTDDRGTTDTTDDQNVVHDFYISFDAKQAKPYNLKRKDLHDIEVEYPFGMKKGGLEAYTEFWKRYKRPPKKEYWDFIINRLDLLVPQDVRERKGAFFTPQKWVEKSQQYLADVLGENWQDEYIVWDCCAGTGNLLAGLTNKYNIWASTLDQQDVDVMKERSRNGANLLESHIFQFDFLNDDFDRLPENLHKIIDDPEQRKKLVIYINPPYAEATTATTITGTGQNKAKVATDNKTYLKHKDKIGKAGNELFAQFFTRIYCEIPGVTLAEFSTLKILQASNFVDFRKLFQARLQSLFLMPAKTFDNVKGSFPIGFHIWNTNIKETFTSIEADVYDQNGEFLQKKIVSNSYLNQDVKSLNQWIKLHDDKKNDGIGFLGNPSPDFQHSSQMYLSYKIGIEHFNFWNVTQNNMIYGCIYFAVRQCIEATWFNDRDQFLHPHDGWQADKEFQADCLAFTLLHGQNRITSSEGVNHWIPFSEDDVKARDKFDSHFMKDFIAGKLPKKFLASDNAPKQGELSFAEEAAENPLYDGTQKIDFSPEAQNVLNAGLQLWIYYHDKADKSAYHPNASFYDIKEYFQGRNNKGKMNSKSTNETYNTLISDLRDNLKTLAKKIERKVYQYGFLR